MALVWNWKDKCGEMCVVQSHPDEEDQMFTVDLYQGNAYLIMIHEFKEADKDKAKYKYSKEVVAAFSEAFSDIVIELFSEKRVDERVKDDASIE